MNTFWTVVVVFFTGLLLLSGEMETVDGFAFVCLVLVVATVATAVEGRWGE